MNADGNGQGRLLDDGAVDAEPFFSPDGTRIAFDRYSETRVDLFVANADGTNRERLTTACDDVLGAVGDDAVCEDETPSPSWQPVVPND